MDCPHDPEKVDTKREYRRVFTRLYSRFVSTLEGGYMLSLRRTGRRGYLYRYRDTPIRSRTTREPRQLE